MESQPVLDLGNPSTKTTDMSTQGRDGIGRAEYKPWFDALDLAFLQTTHRPHILSMSFIKTWPVKMLINCLLCFPNSDMSHETTSMSFPKKQLPQRTLRHTQAVIKE
ncbi:hypothetical protein Bca52824_001171 [Brassica carinata]|uniref:Uncharacterized protein n=1 Tax=Brassica carinata TaxID=52824 RepID=A0A8X7WI01_BRACI|nr:hypothetical protein Bca52824_001171 [Brassica carinata]